MCLWMVPTSTYAVVPLRPDPQCWQTVRTPSLHCFLFVAVCMCLSIYGCLTKTVQSTVGVAMLFSRDLVEKSLKQLARWHQIVYEWGLLIHETENVIDIS